MMVYVVTDNWCDDTTIDSVWRDKILAEERAHQIDDTYRKKGSLNGFGLVEEVELQ